MKEKMKKVVYWVMTVFIGWMGGGGAPVAASEFDEEFWPFDIDIVITEIVPSDSGVGSFVMESKTLPTPDDRYLEYSFRLDRADVDPYEIEDPFSLVEEIHEIQNLSAIPLHLGGGYRVEAKRGLPMRDELRDEEMSFYFAVAHQTYDGIRSRITWLGVRKISYADCVRNAEFRNGVVCGLKEQKDGVFYYDAYIDGELVENDDGGGDEGNVDEYSDGLGGEELDGNDDDLREENVDVVENNETDGETVVRNLSVMGDVNDGGKTDGDARESSRELAKSEVEQNPSVMRRMSEEKVEEVFGGGVSFGWLWVIWLIALVVMGWWFFMRYWRRRSEEKERDRLVSMLK